MNNCITADEKNIESCEKIVDYFKKIDEYKKKHCQMILFYI